MALAGRGRALLQLAPALHPSLAAAAELGLRSARGVGGGRSEEEELLRAAGPGRGAEHEEGNWRLVVGMGEQRREKGRRRRGGVGDDRGSPGPASSFSFEEKGAAVRALALRRCRRRMHSRIEGMYFCIPSLFRAQNASRDASSVGGGTERAQWPARGKNALASRCWGQSKQANLFRVQSSDFRERVLYELLDYVYRELHIIPSQVCLVGEKVLILVL